MTPPPPHRHLAIVGTTAAGKSALAMALARSHDDIEIVSVDSMQVYRGMDIGTAKPTRADQVAVPHHLIDLTDASDDFTLSRFQAAFRDVIAQIEGRGRRALLVGGTGLYLSAAIDGLEIPGQYPEVRNELEAEPDTQLLHRRLTDLDPVAAARMEPTNRRRVVRALEVTLGTGRPFSSFGPGIDAYPPSPFALFGLRVTPSVTAERIAARFRQQMDAGFLDEVRRLSQAPDGMSRTARQALGYRELLEHLEHGVPVEEAVEAAIVHTRRFARRQRSWFGRDPRITWLDADDEPRGLLPVLLRDWYECV